MTAIAQAVHAKAIEFGKLAKEAATLRRAAAVHDGAIMAGSYAVL